MAVKIRRTYKGAAASAVLDSAGVSSTIQTAVGLTTSPSNWPAGKFFVVVAPGTAQEEKMCVTLSGSILTVVDPTNNSLSADDEGRGVDDTAARSTIAGGSTVYPVFTATDANEANELTSTYAAQGGIVYQGASTFAQLGIGTAGQVMRVNSGATAPEWGQVATAGLADSSVTSAKIVDATIVAGDLASNAVTTAKILDANVTTGKLADASVTSPKLAAPTLTAKTDTFTLALVDANCTMQCNKATAMDVEVPGSGIAFANGTVITLVNYGAGQVTVKPLAGSSVDIRSSNGLKLRTQYSMASLVKISDTEWVLSGDTVTA
jgi:hypothetical protein